MSEQDKADPAAAKSNQKQARAERQAAALRANLKRRKEQAREQARARRPDDAKSSS